MRNDSKPNAFLAYTSSFLRPYLTHAPEVALEQTRRTNSDPEHPPHEHPSPLRKTLTSEWRSPALGPSSVRCRSVSPFLCGLASWLLHTLACRPGRRRPLQRFPFISWRLEGLFGLELSLRHDRCLRLAWLRRNVFVRTTHGAPEAVVAEEATYVALLDWLQSCARCLPGRGLVGTVLLCWREGFSVRVERGDRRHV